MSTRTIYKHDEAGNITEAITTPLPPRTHRDFVYKERPASDPVPTCAECGYTPRVEDRELVCTEDDNLVLCLPCRVELKFEGKRFEELHTHDWRGPGDYEHLIYRVRIKP